MLRLLAAAIACASFLQAVDTEDRIRKSLPVASATRLTLDAEFGGIQVQPGDGKNVEVEVNFHGDPPSRSEFDRMLRDFTLDVEQQGSDIHVHGTFHDGWKPMLSFELFNFGHSICRNGQCLEYSRWLRQVEYRIKVPQKFDADVRTSGGPISVSSLKGELKAHTSGGPIRITEVAGDVDVSTSGGPISIERTAGRVKAHTSGGPIEISEATGAVDASTSGGPMRASLAAQPKAECRLYTSGGSIDVSLGKDIRMDLDASTSGGRVWTDFAVPSSGERHQSELHAPINGGGPRLYLHTSGGGISVRRTG